MYELGIFLCLYWLYICSNQINKKKRYISRAVIFWLRLFLFLNFIFYMMVSMTKVRNDGITIYIPWMLLVVFLIVGLSLRSASGWEAIFWRFNCKACENVLLCDSYGILKLLIRAFHFFLDKKTKQKNQEENKLQRALAKRFFY